MMPSIFRVARYASATLFAAASLYAEAHNAAPVITDAWVKTTVPGGTVSAAYMTIKSTKPIRLVKAATPLAGIVEIHHMNMQGGVMEMKAVNAVDIAPNQPVELKPGGLHVMLMKVGKPINIGDKVPLVLTFERADRKSLIVKLDVTAREAAPRRQPR